VENYVNAKNTINDINAFNSGGTWYSEQLAKKAITFEFGEP
jgi:hypothetical protein